MQEVHDRPELAAAVAWVAACAMPPSAHGPSAAAVTELPPSDVKRVKEETVRAVRALDPIAEGVARSRARQAAAERLDVLLADLALHEAIDSAAWADALTDAVLAIYHGSLVHGAGLEVRS